MVSCCKSWFHDNCTFMTHPTEASLVVDLQHKEGVKNLKGYDDD